MAQRKPPKSPPRTDASLVRSSAAEYLTFVAATGGGSASVEMRYEDENLWLTQKMMATLYDVSVPTISQHLKRIYADNELTREATVKQYLMVQTEGEREVQRKLDHYSLQAIIAVGFKIENERAVQFRKWANQIVKDYPIQGWAMDVNRLKSGGSVLTEDFFDANWKRSGRSGFPSESSTRRSPISTPPHSTMSRPPRPPNAFSPPCKTSCITPFMTRRRRRSSWIAPTTAGSTDAGKVTAEIARTPAESEFEKYRITQDRLFESDLDRLIKQIGAASQPDGDED